MRAWMLVSILYFSILGIPGSASDTLKAEDINAGGNFVQTGQSAMQSSISQTGGIGKATSGYSEIRVGFWYAVQSIRQQPNISVFPDVLDFGYHLISSELIRRKLIISNNGENSLIFQGAGIELVGDNPESFWFEEEPDLSPLPAMSTRELWMDFSPDEEGDRRADLRIYSNDINRPVFTVVLFGSGQIPTPTPTSTPTPTDTSTPTDTPTATITNTPTQTPTITLTPTITPTYKYSPTPSPTGIATFPPTHIPTFTPTSTSTITSTLTITPTPTFTSTIVSTWTPTLSPTFTSTQSPTPSCTCTSTVTPTPTQTQTRTITRTPTPTGSPTWTATSTPTLTPTPTITPTRTRTLTPTPTATVTSTATPVPSYPSIVVFITNANGSMGSEVIIRVAVIHASSIHNRFMVTLAFDAEVVQAKADGIRVSSGWQVIGIPVIDNEQGLITLTIGRAGKMLISLPDMSVLCELGFKIVGEQGRETDIAVDQARVDGEWDVTSDAQNGQIGVLDYPAALTWRLPDSLTDTSVELAWIPGGESNLTSYRVILQTQSGLLIGATEVDTLTTGWKVEGLRSGARLEALLSGVNDLGEGETSSFRFETRLMPSTSKIDSLSMMGDEWQIEGQTRQTTVLESFVPVTADLNEDGKVDYNDLLELFSWFMTPPEEP